MAEGSDNKNILSELDRRLANLSRTTEKVLNEQIKHCSQLDMQRKHMKEKIRKARKAIDLHVDKIEQELENKIKKSYEDSLDKVTKTKEYFMERYDEIDALRNELKVMQDKSFDAKTAKTLETKTEKQEESVRVIEKQATVPDLDLQISEHILHIERVIPYFGLLVLKEKKNTDSVILIPTTEHQPQVEHTGTEHNKLTLATEHTKIKPAALLNTAKIGKNIEVFRICFVPGNKLFFCEMNAKCIHNCNTDGSGVNTIKLDLKPINVTHFDKENAIIAYDKGIQIFNLRSMKTGVFLKRGGGCRAIACSNDKIWVRNGFQYLNLIDTNGKLLKELKVKFDPSEICVSSAGNMYSISAGKDVIYSISPDGQQRVFYSSPNLSYPVGIAADDNNVYVAGCGSNNVHRISNDGQTSDVILSADDGIEQPTGLAINRETNELLIIHDDSKCVNTYKLN